jgi:hypothetical protein
MSCINKANPKYKTLSDVFGETITESMVRNYPVNIGKEDLYIPTINELKKWLNTSKRKAFNNVTRAFELNPYISKSAIKFFLKGIINEKDGTLFITKGFTTTGSAVLNYEAIQTVFNPNYAIVKALADKYPSVFKIKDTRDKYTKVVEIKPETPALFSKESKKRGQQDLTIKEKYFPTNVQKSSEVVKKISESSHPLSKLAKQLLKYVEKNDVDIQLVDDAIPFEVTGMDNAAGVYISSSNQIYIHKDAWFKGLGSENTILHEVLHSLSYDRLRRNGGKESFTKLYNYAKSKIKDYNYGLTNEDEFLAELFTNADFIKKLQSVPGTGEEYKNLWEQLLDYILGLFNITRSSSLYEEAFAVATQVIDEQSRYEEAKEHKASYGIAASESAKQPIKKVPESNEKIAEKEAVEILKTYLSNFGVTVKELEGIKSQFGMDSVGVADILSKIIYIKDRKNLPYATGKFVAYMMQHNPLVKNMILDLARAHKDLKETKNAIYYVSSGLGKTELVKKNPNKFADMDELIENVVKRLYGKSFGLSENSKLIYDDERLRDELKKEINKVKQTKIILSPISSDKIKLIGFSYKKYYIPSSKNINKIITGLSERKKGAYDIERSLYKELYVDPFLNNEKIKNVTEIDGYISDEFKDINESQQLLEDFLSPEDYIIENNYKDLDKDKYFDIIGGLIAKDFANKTELRYSRSLISKIKEIINKFLSLLTNAEVKNINTSIGQITDAIIRNDKDFITASKFKPGAEGKVVSKVSVEKALSQDDFGKSVIFNLSQKGFILTGSTALSEQGLILRPDENMLHDIDWVSPFSRAETVEKFLSVYPSAIKVRDIVNEKEGYITDSYLIAPDAHSISNYKTIVTTTGKILIDSYDVVDKNNKVVGTYKLQTYKGKSKEVVNGLEAKVIDFFTYEDYASRNKYAAQEFVTKEGKTLYLANWKDIFAAKLNWARYKDIWDYNRFLPTKVSNQELQIFDKNSISLNDIGKIYYEKSSDYRSKNSKETFLNKANDFLDALDGFKINANDVIEQLKCL